MSHAARVLAHATACYHAGAITLEEWQACVAEFTRTRRRPPGEEPPTPGGRHTRPASRGAGGTTQPHPTA